MRICIAHSAYTGPLLVYGARISHIVYSIYLYAKCNDVYVYIYVYNKTGLASGANKLAVNPQPTTITLHTAPFKTLNIYIIDL